jgi:NADPH:quinone reductase-like Zn-dependent oxidoreductase
MGSEQPGEEPAAPAGTMRAVVQDRYGPVDQLRLVHMERPTIADDEVLVQVEAAGVDRGTWHTVTGRPYLIRLGFGFRGPKGRVIGLDVSGTVEAVGSGVTRFAPGDQVFGIGRGSFAEYATAREDKLAHRPANCTPAQAAVLLVSGGTALQALQDTGRVEAGQQVLVIGASGGVGSYAVQLAKAFGAEVTGVCSTSKIDLVRSLGADEVLDYTKDDVTDGSRRYDLVLDIGGRRSLPRLRRALTPKGTLVTIGGEGGNRWTGGFGRSLRAPVLSLFVGQRLTMLITKERASDAERLAELVEAGKVTPALERTFPLDEAADAVRHVEAGRARGKVAITI